MEEKIVEGLWDCPYCNTKGIGGLTKHCPECGHPQDKDIKFYMGERKHYLSEDEARVIGDASDWVCDYCSSLNNAKYIYCSNCGAKREKETKDYFENKTTEDIPTKEVESAEDKTASSFPEEKNEASIYSDFVKKIGHSANETVNIFVIFLFLHLQLDSSSLASSVLLDCSILKRFPQQYPKKNGNAK